MTLESAIASLSVQLEVKNRLGKTEEANAIELGIEGLQRIQKQRKSLMKSEIVLLPTETQS